MDEGTSDYDLAMEWYLKYGERCIVKHMDDVIDALIWRLKGRGLLGDTTESQPIFTFVFTPKALKLIKEHNGTDS